MKQNGTNGAYDDPQTPIGTAGTYNEVEKTIYQHDVKIKQMHPTDDKNQLCRYNKIISKAGVMMQYAKKTFLEPCNYKR
jgi:hypothetical protein